VPGQPREVDLIDELSFRRPGGGQTIQVDHR